MSRKRQTYNINRIRGLLWNNHKQRFGFKSFKDTKQTAFEVKAFLIQSKKPVSIKNVKDIVNDIRPKQEKLKDPTLPDKYLEPQHYFLISQFLDIIKSADERINFRSSARIIPKDTILKGGVKYSYVETFKNWVDLINKIKIEKEKEGLNDIYEVEFYYCLEQQPQKTDGIWYADIISCDVNGKPQNYLDKKDYLDLEEKKITPKEVKEEPESKKAELKLSEQSLKEIEQSKVIAKEKTASLERLLKDKVITFDQYLQGLQAIK